MNLLLLRHTRVDLPEGICYGASDVGLAADHPAAFAAIAAGLPTCWQRILCSPLQRCRLLAAHLAAGRSVTLDPRLAEVDFGDWELQPWATIPPADYQAWGADWVQTAPPGGESLTTMAARVQAALDEAVSQAGDLLVVCHGGPIRAMLAGLLGLSLREAFGLAVDRGHHYHLHRAADGWQVLAANQAPGL